MSPKLFECRLFMKYNRKFWDFRLLVKAYRLAKQKVKDARAQKAASDVDAEFELVNEIAKEFENSLEI